MGYDSDHPRAEGEVGKVGVAIDSLDDMRLLLAGLPLDKVTTSMTINATAAILLLLYQLVAEEQGVARRPAARHDPERHPQGVHRPGHLHLPAAPVDAARRPTPSPTAPSDLPSWNTISISGYHIREAGSTAVQEIAFTLANGIAYVEAALAAGLDVDAFAPRLSFFFNAHNNLFEEVAKFRAARRMWARIMTRALRGQGRAVEAAALPHPDRRLDPDRPAAGEQHRPGDAPGAGRRPAAAPRACTPTASTRRSGCRPSGPPRSRCAPSRSSASSPAWPTPSTRWPAPTSSSRLTDEVERAALGLLSRIDALGGAVAAIEADSCRRRSSRPPTATPRPSTTERDRGRRQPLRRAGSLGTEVFPIDPALQRGQIERLKALRAARDQVGVDAAMDDVRAAARGTQNLLVPMRVALKRRATLGEVSDALRGVFGEFQPSR